MASRIGCRGWSGQKSPIAASPPWPGTLARFQTADGWARVPGTARLWFAGSKGRCPLVRVPQGRNALCPGSGGGKPLGRTTSGGESRDSKGRLWSPFSAERCLQRITALLVVFFAPAFSGRRAFSKREWTATDKHLQSGCQCHFQRDFSLVFCYTKIVLK
jgi:hypothetical protein